MRIAIDIRHLAKQKPSGVGEYTLQILRALFELDSGDDFILFSAGSESARRDCLDNLGTIEIERFRSHVRHIHLSIPNRKLNLQIALTGNPKLDTWVCDECGGCDVFFFPNINFITMERTPYVLMLHDASWKLFPDFFTSKDQLAFKLNKPDKVIKEARAVITPSLSTRLDAINLLGAPENNTHVIPHGIDHEVFHHKPIPQDHGIKSKYALNRPYLLYLGTLEPRKNLQALLEAFDATRQNYPELQLVIAGGSGWKSDKLRQQISNNPNVTYLEYVPAEHRPALYRSAKAVIFPSIYEGFGLPVLEAMTCGTPVITSHTSSLPEITNDSALLIDPFNSKDIELAMAQILDSPQLAQSLRKSGIKQAINFSWKKAAEKTLEVIKKQVH